MPSSKGPPESQECPRRKVRLNLKNASAERSAFCHSFTGDSPLQALILVTSDEKKLTISLISVKISKDALMSDNDG